jgi:hypothetical protein
VCVCVCVYLPVFLLESIVSLLLPNSFKILTKKYSKRKPYPFEVFSLLFNFFLKKILSTALNIDFQVVKEKNELGAKKRL